MAQLPRINPNPCSESANRANWGRVAEHWGQVIVGPDDTTLDWLENKIGGDSLYNLTQVVVSPGPSGDQVQVRWNNSNVPVLGYVATYSPSGVVWVSSSTFSSLFIRFTTTSTFTAGTATATVNSYWGGANPGATVTITDLGTDLDAQTAGLTGIAVYDADHTRWVVIHYDYKSLIGYSATALQYMSHNDVRLQWATFSVLSQVVRNAEYDSGGKRLLQDVTADVYVASKGADANDQVILTATRITQVARNVSYDDTTFKFLQDATADVYVFQAGTETNDELIVDLVECG